MNVYIRKKSSREEKYLVRDLIGQVRYFEHWFACDCRADPKPLMAPVRKGNGTVTFMRMTSRSNHDPACPFREIEYIYKQERKRAKQIEPKSVLKLHLLYKKPSDIENGKKKGSGDRGGSYPKLARVLHTWMERAGLNQVEFPVIGIKDQYQRIRESVKDYFLSSGIPVIRYFDTFPGHVSRMAVNLKKGLSEWNSLVRPYGILIVAANRYRDGKLFCSTADKDIEIGLSGPVRQLSGRMGEDSGPILAIFTVTNSPEDSHFFGPKSAFIRPVYSKKILFPVDSRYERLVFRDILKWLPWWSSKGKIVRVVKPLFAMPVLQGEDSQEVLPDFLIQIDGKTFILEVMGSVDEEYTERKKGLIPIMASLGKVFEFNALRAEVEGDWNYRMKYLLKGLSREILNKEV